MRWFPALFIMKTIKIETPQGYEIDKEKSTFESIVSKPVIKDMENNKELIEKLLQAPFIQELFEIFNTGYMSSTSGLVGGAIIDILNDKTPKDYDIVGYSGSTDKFLKAGFTFTAETKTAITLKRKEIIVQLLKTNRTEFDYTISQILLNKNSKKEPQLYVDKISFENKILIPTAHSFDKPSAALSALRRIPHWRNKGYIIPDITYLSLLNVAAKSKNYKNS